MQATPVRSDPSAAHAAFPTTQWTLVVATAGSSPASEAALEDLCRTYWPPLYTFLRRQGSSSHDAQDLVQGFIQRILQRSDLMTVSPDKGRFRTFLLTALRNFSIKQADHDKALKRGGGAVFVAIDAQEAERLSLPDLSAESPEVAFDRQWARTTLGRALERLRQDYSARKKEKLFDTLSPFLEGAEAHEYEKVQESLHMKPGAISVAVHRMRGRLMELLRAEVLRTIGPGTDVETELRELLEVLART